MTSSFSNTSNMDKGEMTLGSSEQRSFQGFGKRTTTFTKISNPPGGHTQLNLFGDAEVPQSKQINSVNRCQFERNKSTITEQYTGTVSEKQAGEVEPIKSEIIEHALPEPKKTATKVIQPPGGRTTFSLFG
eukprot:sb/3475073/